MASSFGSVIVTAHYIFTNSFIISENNIIDLYIIKESDYIEGETVDNLTITAILTNVVADQQYEVSNLESNTTYYICGKEVEEYLYIFNEITTIRGAIDVKGKYIKDENGDIISPVTSMDTIYYSNTESLYDYIDNQLKWYVKYYGAQSSAEMIEIKTTPAFGGHITSSKKLIRFGVILPTPVQMNRFNWSISKLILSVRTADGVYCDLITTRNCCYRY